MRLVGLLGGLDDESRGLGVELVDMGLEPAVLGAAKVEGEGVEELLRAEPDVAVRADDQIGLEHVGVAVPDFGIEAIGGDDEIGVGEFEIAVHFLVERQLDPEPLASALQNVEQLLAADADEAVARACAGAFP